MSLQFTLTTMNMNATFQKYLGHPNAYYTKEQLLGAFDKMCNQQYDRDVAEQIFEQCQLNLDRVKLEEVIYAFIEADKILKRKIVMSEQQVAQYTKEKQDCQNQYQQSKYNAMGQSRSSQLQIAIKEVQSNKRFQNETMYRVVVTLGQYQQLADVANKIDESHQLNFQVESHSDNIQFQLFSPQFRGDYNLLGDGQLELTFLKDQQVHDQPIPIRDQKSNQQIAQIMLEAQWIFDKAQYYENLITRYDEVISQLQLDLEDFQRDLALIQMPFSGGPPQRVQPQGYQAFGQSQQSNSNQQFQPQQQYGQQQQPWRETADQIKPGSFQNSLSQQQQYQQAIYQSPGNQMQDPSKIPTDQGTSEELQIGFVLICVMGLFLLLECYARPDFCGVLVFLILLTTVLRDCFDLQHLLVTGILVVTSIINDIIWLSIYSEWWFANDYSVPQWSSEGVSVLRFSIVFCFFNLIVKAILCYFLYHFYREIQANKSFRMHIFDLQIVVGEKKQNLYKIENGLLQ